MGVDFGASPGAVGQLSALHVLIAVCVVVILGIPVSVPAPGYGVLAVWRGLAGLGRATIGATCSASASDLCPDPRRRNRAIGIRGVTGSELRRLALGTGRAATLLPALCGLADLLRGLRAPRHAATPPPSRVYVAMAGLVPFAMCVELGTGTLYLLSSILLLEAMPEAPERP